MVVDRTMAKRKAVSLSNELHVLIRAVDGARVLADRSTDSTLDDTSVPSSIEASLVLVVERLRLLDRVVRDAVDPRLLWCDENDHNPPLVEACRRGSARSAGRRTEPKPHRHGCGYRPWADDA